MVNDDSVPKPPSSDTMNSQRSSSQSNERPTNASTKRSNPIAIARTSISDQFYASDDEEEEKDNTRNVNPGGAAQSLPSRLLRAPFLGSMPTATDDIRSNSLNYDQTVLPPPMLQSDYQEDKDSLHQPATYSERINYGSLRESHMRGRFLDGPASYRDKRTGGIMQLQHKVRFQDGAPVASSMPQYGSQLLSIGDRLRRVKLDASSKNADDCNANKKQGSLGDVLQASPMLLSRHDSPRGGLPSPPPLDLQSQTFSEPAYDFDAENMLSTSLTALEMLQSGAIPKEARRSNIVEDDQYSLPRNALGQNALLSRALSDPMPCRQSLHNVADSSFVLQNVGELATGSSRRIHDPSDQVGFVDARTSVPFSSFVPYSRSSLPEQFIGDQCGQGQPALQSRGLSQHDEFYTGTNAPVLRHQGSNPDTEGAFDMDLEL